nr:SpoIIE family protein phosphatase [Lysobacter sp. CAU 1642]
MRMKVIAVLVPVMALLLTALYLLMSGVISRGFAQIEEQHMQRNVQRVRAALEQEMQAVRASARDWGSWTDLYDWMESGDSGFVERSLRLGAEGLERLGIDLLAVRAHAGGIRFGEQLDPGAEDATIEPDARMRALIDAHPALAAPSKEAGGQVGLLADGGQLLIMAGSPVLDSDEQRASRGSVILVRLLDEDFMARLSDRVGLSLAVSPAGPEGWQGEPARLAVALGRSPSGSLIKALGEERIAGYFLIEGPGGETLALVEVSQDRPIHRQGQLSLRYLLGVFMLAAVAILAALVLLLNNVVLRRILQLSAEVNQISRSSDLRLRTSAEGRDEIGHLGREMNDMLRALEAAAEKERKYIREIDASLKLAASIQSSMLSRDFGDGAGVVDLHAQLIPAKTVGGDFYDFFWLDTHRLAFVIADVSGKGVPAGLFMVKAKSVIKTAASVFSDPGEIVARANDELSAGNDESMFVTALFGVLDTASGELELVNAGHNPPMLIEGPQRSVRELRLEQQVVLGAMDGLPYASTRLHLQPGDRLFIYTDGVNEAMDPDNVEFGYARLVESLSAASGDAAAIDAAVVDAVQAFARGAEQSDDITVMCLAWLRPGSLADGLG